MKVANVEIIPGLYYMGVNERHAQRFENLWPLPHGVAYNAYLILDEKVALLDTVCLPQSDKFIEGVLSKMDNFDIDYLITLHVEPDHSGAYEEIIARYPNITLVGNKITKRMLTNMYKLKNFNFLEVKDGDTLNLGSRTLRFITTPNCHWPESMMAYDETNQVLFSQDVFGGFATLNGRIFDDEMCYECVEDETRRYYSNIVGKHSCHAQKALQKIENLPIKVICPVHGNVWRKNTQKIISEYKKWANYQTEKGVVIAFGSMYGSTEATADILARFLVEEGISEVKVYDLSNTHASYVISDMWKYRGLILAAPTYNCDILPVVRNYMNLLDIFQPQKHILSYFTTYGWASVAHKMMKEWAEQSSFEVVDAGEKVDINGTAGPADIEKLRKLAKVFAERLHELENTSDEQVQCPLEENKECDFPL